MPRPLVRPVATLWALSWNGDRLSCAVFRASHGTLEIRLQSATKTILIEPFDLGPRALARVRALKRSLVRRGWRDDRA